LTLDIQVPAAPTSQNIRACNFEIVIPAAANVGNGYTTLEQFSGGGWSQVSSASSSQRTVKFDAQALTSYTFRTRENACGATKYSSSLTSRPEH
jgi:hypothetical protein